jgi:hypothetical protein
MDTVGGSRRFHSYMGFEQDIRGRTRPERALEGLREGFAKVTLLNHWNAYQSSFASLNAADRILTDAVRFKRGQVISKSRRNALTLAGIDDDGLLRIADSFEGMGHRAQDGDFKFASSEEWTDMRAKEAFENAVLQDVQRTIIRPGAGETPRFMSIPVVNLLGQFKTFAFSSAQKIMLSSLSRRDAAVASGVLAAVFWGGITEATKNKIAGRDTALDTDADVARFTANAVDRSGIMGIFFDVNNMMEKTIGVGVQPLIGGDGATRFSSRGQLDSVVGPTFGLAEDFLRLAKIPASGMNEGDLRAIRRMLPYQNLFYIRGLLDSLQEEVREASNLPKQRPR